MKLGMLVAVSATMMAGAATAADWRLVSASPTGAIAIDLQSINRQGQRVTAWTAIVFPRTLDGAEYILVRQEHDCQAMTSEKLASVAYDANGLVLDRSDERSRKVHVAPDTNEMLLHEAACYGRFQIDDPEGWDHIRALMRDYRTTDFD